MVFFNNVYFLNLFDHSHIIYDILISINVFFIWLYLSLYIDATMDGRWINSRQILFFLLLEFLILFLLRFFFFFKES